MIWLHIMEALNKEVSERKTNENIWKSKEANKKNP